MRACVRACACALTFPACTAHEPHYQLWPVWLHHKFRHYLINGTIFGRKLLNTKYMFRFSLQLLSEIFFFILRRIQRHTIINIHTFSCKVPVILDIFQWNLTFLNRFPVKKLKHQILSKSVQWKSSCSMRTDRHGEAKSCFSKFCESA